MRKRYSGMQLGIGDEADGAARDAGIVVVPAMAFFGGLGDLLATAAMGDWAAADEIVLAYALDSWKPTSGTRLTGKRNTGRRFVFTRNNLEFVPDPAPKRVWNFPEPFGTQNVESICLSEIVTISHHLPVSEVHAFMNPPPLRDIHDPKTPPPTASDERGRSSQTFLVDVVARKGFEERHASACGRDIYAISAPIVVEAAQSIATGLARKRGPGNTSGCFRGLGQPAHGRGPFGGHVFKVHLPYGFSSIKLVAITAAGPQFGPPGYECNLLYLACLATLVLGGSGPLPIDGFLEERRKLARRN